MDGQRSMEKMEAFYKKYRRIDSVVNSLAEDYYFYSNDLRGAKKQFWPLIAGITHPSADYYCQISQKNRIAPYTVVLEYVVSGKGYIETEGKRYEVHAGDTYIINRAIPAKWYSDRNDPYEKKWFNFTGRFADALMYTYNLNEPVYVVQMDSEDKLDEIHRILMEFDFQNPRQDNFRLMKLVMEVLERMVTRLEKKQEKPERVAFNQIVEYISVNLRLEQLTPASLSLSFYISERTLSRMFAKNIGISPAKYIMLKRVEFSKQLLSTTKYTVEEISEMLHFSGSRHFRHVFTECYGMPPTEWRRKSHTEEKDPYAEHI